MGEVLVLDKSKADILLSLGFRYTERKINNQVVFVFIQTKELMNELASKFEEGSFFIKQNSEFLRI